MRRARNGEPLEWLLWALTQETDECLLWPFATMDNGYGVSDNRDSTGSRLVHRFICDKTKGVCPPNHEAAHSCRTQRCCNKRHLSWKLHPANEHDKIGHGTRLYGVKNHKAKLNETDVLFIKSELSKGRSGRSLAQLFNVDPMTISFIKNGKNWNWLR